MVFNMLGSVFRRTYLLEPAWSIEIYWQFDTLGLKNIEICSLALDLLIEILLCD
jgi:hypothetical protein